MGVGRIILGGPHPRRPSSVPVTKILSTYAHCRHPQYFCAKTKTSNKSQFVCPCHLGTPEPLSKGGIYEIYFSRDSNVKNTNKKGCWNTQKMKSAESTVTHTRCSVFCKPLPALFQGFSKDTFSSTLYMALYRAYLIFVIFFTRAKFLENKIHTEIYTVNCQFTQ